MSARIAINDFMSILRGRRTACDSLDAFGARFFVCELTSGWSAVAYLCGHSQIAGGSDESEKLTKPFWIKTLPAIQNDLQRAADDRVYKHSKSKRVSLLDIDRPCPDSSHPGPDRIHPADSRPLSIVCKQGRAETLRQKFGTYFKGPKEWREFWTGHQLLQSGLRTPMPLACMWRRVGFGHFEAILITEFIRDALPLDRAVNLINGNDSNASSGGRVHPTRERALDLLTQKMVRLLNSLGRQSFYHRDLKVGNVLVAGCPSDPRPWLIDLDGIHGEASPFGPGFDRSIVRLVSSLIESTDLRTRDYLHALRFHLTELKIPAGQWREEWTKLQAGITPLIRKQNRRRKQHFRHGQ